MTTDYTKLRELIEEAQAKRMGWLTVDQLRAYLHGPAEAAYIAAASPDVVFSILSERNELRLAYIEASRQKNELLTAHKFNARERDADREAMRHVLLSFGSDDEMVAINALRARLGYVHAIDISSERVQKSEEIKHD